MKEFMIYEAGGMSKFNKENFDESNNWRKYCAETLQHFECDL